MIDVNDLRKGVTFTMDGNLYRVVEYSHHKPGRGNATIRTKLYNLRTGSNTDKTFTSGDRVQDIRLETRSAQYLYNDGDLYYFMDNTSFEQTAIGKTTLGEHVDYLRENLDVKLTFFEEQPLDVELPMNVDLKIVECEPGVRGDTATGANKQATLETGLKVMVPLFINLGDTIRVSTETGAYVTRA